MADFPNLRAHNTCVRCGHAKDHGYVICPHCSAALKNAYGLTWGPWEGKLAVIEGGMEARRSTQP